MNGVCNRYYNCIISGCDIYKSTIVYWIWWRRIFYSFDGFIQDLRVYKGVAKYKGGFDVSKPYAPVGIGTFREVPDTCTNNFATFNSGLLV